MQTVSRFVLNARDFEFRWTVRRRRYWKICRRKYFFYYYASRGGHGENAPRAVRELYAAKKTLMLEEYLRRVVNLAMREIFFAPFDDEAKNLPPLLAETARRRAEREFGDMLQGKSPVTLFELVQGDVTVAALHRQMADRLTEIVSHLEKSGFGEFLRIPPRDRRYLDSPLDVSIAQLTCSLAPLFAVRRAGQIWMVEGTGCATDGNEIALLDKFAAAKLWGCAPDRVKSFIFPENGAGDFLEIGADADMSEVLRGIRRDVDEMISVIRDDGTVCEEDFPQNTSACAQCVFAGFCRRGE